MEITNQINENDILNPFKETSETELPIDDFITSLKKESEALDDEIVKEERVTRLIDLASRFKGETKLISSLDYVEIIKNQPVQPKIHTKFKGLDDLICGFRPGQLVSISAVAKSGKTNFCMELTANQVDFNPVWFPFEEGAHELVEKFVDRGETPPLFFVPAKIHSRTLKFIELKIIEAKGKYDSKIFYIDNLDWIVDPRGQDHERMIQHACMELKRMAVLWDVTIVLIAHVKKLMSPTDQPNYNDIKGSSSVYQISDTVIMMWRETKKENGELVITNNVNVSVQLNRKTGKTGNIKFKWDNGHYTEYDWNHNDEDLDRDFDSKIVKQPKQTKTW
jgi:replicative DNA helicase